MWGTDWTRAFAVVNYEQAVEPFRRTDRLSESERVMLMSGSCAKVSGWSPRKTRFPIAGLDLEAVREVLLANMLA